MIPKIKGVIGLAIFFMAIDIAFNFTGHAYVEYLLIVALFSIAGLLDICNDNELTRVNKKEETS